MERFSADNISVLFSSEIRQHCSVPQYLVTLSNYRQKSYCSGFEKFASIFLIRAMNNEKEKETYGEVKQSSLSFKKQYFLLLDTPILEIEGHLSRKTILFSY
jgi:hypothetical protein